MKATRSRWQWALGNRDAFGPRVLGPIIFIVGLIVAGLLIAFGLQLGPFHEQSVGPTPMPSQAIDVTIPDDVGQSPRTTSPTSTATTSKDPPPPAAPSKDQHSGQPTEPTPAAGQPAAPATSEPPPHKLVTVDVPGAVFDRLGPQHDTGPTAPQVAAAAAGVSILVALLALFGVFRTVRGKWVDDQLADIWERFTWIIDKPRYEFFVPADRGNILLSLAERAERFNDSNLQHVISRFQLTVIDDIARQLEINPHTPLSDRTNDYIDRVQQSRVVSAAVKDRAAKVRGAYQAEAQEQERTGNVVGTTASRPPGEAATVKGRRLAVTPTIGQTVQPTSPLRGDAVEQICDEFTRQLQDAITHGPKTAGRQSDFLDVETMDAVNEVATQHPRATPDSVANALGEFQRQLDGTHYKERDAVWRAAKAGEIASTVTTMELTETNDASGGAGRRRTVEIVLPDSAAARAWVLRNRQYPFLSRIYVETVFGSQYRPGPRHQPAPAL